ncbi:MAG: branched-chain amino acid ABC transporter permease, partial [Thermodesulfobacteriota bacterium]
MGLENHPPAAGLFGWTMTKLGFSPLGLLGLGALAVLPLVPPFDQEYLIRWLIMACTMGAAAMAFDFSGGFIAVINFGFMAFFGLGAYTSALVAIHYGLSPWLGMVAGALTSAALGFWAGAVTLRLRGMMILCFTWFIGLALMGLATKAVDLTHGPRGLICPPLFPDSSNLPYFYTVLAMLLATYVALKSVVRSHLGLAFRAIGQNMEAARTSGLNPLKYRILNFTLSCAFAGWLGGFYAHYYQIITPELLSTGKTVEVLVIAYIGGRSSLWGGAFAAIPFILGMEVIRSSLSNLPGLNLVLYGVFLILIMIY